MKSYKRHQILLLTLIAAIMAAFSVGSGLVPTALALTYSVDLQVVSARTEPRAFGGLGVTQGDPILEYKYIINIDNTGTTTQRTPDDGCTPADGLSYPASCEWPSIAGVAGSSPIYTQGDQDDFAAGMTLPEGRYLISVLADGYKLDGVHFSIPLEDPGLVTVLMQPQPLPTATIHAFVFEDISPTNAAPDVPAEHGLPGFVGHIADYLGEVTTDVFGNPLCTEYETDNTGQIILNPPDYTPTPIPGTGGQCVSDANGDLVIPNLGPNRYALSAVAPDGTDWVQTTTLEGNHDWDAWVMEGSTGLDTEFIVAGEPFPAIIFGFVRPTNTLAGGTGSIQGVIAGAKGYVPGNGGLPGGEGEATIGGAKIGQPIENPWISLTDLTNGDTVVYVGQGDANGAFDITNVPDGNYMLSYWDEPQNYILALTNVTVSNGETVDLGVQTLFGWWTQYDGYVFDDANRNGVMDWTDLDNDGCPDPGEGELGIPNYVLTMRKRENSLMDRGATAVTTDACGYYIMENAYPMTQWLVMEAYNDLYYTTGVTYQADNQPIPTTILGAGVDVSVLPIIGLAGRLDWGVHSYDATGANGIDPRNGGIVGTVSYDTTRNELDAQFAFVEDWQPGVSGLTVNLYEPVTCGTTSAPCDVTGRYELDLDGAYTKGQLLNTYVTETWERPTGCVARDVNGDPLVYPDDQQVLPDYPAAECLEGPLMGVQFQSGFSNVDGNYGFGDGCFNGTLDATDPANPICVGGTFDSLPGGLDYLVEVEIPNDATGRPLYNITREEDINIGNGDQWVPQLPPPICAGALHTVDVADSGTDGYPENTTFISGVTVPASTPTVNTTFLDIDGSPFEGLPKPLCDTKLVPLSNGRSIVPLFNVFTDVPLPGRFWGLLVDDLNFSANPQSLGYGEKAGIPFAPVGIYDWTNRLAATVESDYNGIFEVLMPSTNRINCPTPSGVCANMYRFVGNDPGVPGQLNPNYRPEYRTIAAEFEAIPGLIVPADLAPTQVGVSVAIPGGQIQAVSCAVASTTPQLFTVSQPYVNGTGSFTINGLGFGTGGTVTLDGTIALPTTAWSNTQIDVTVPTGTPFGPHQLVVTAANGQQTINGLTFHVLGSAAATFPSTLVLDDFNRANSNNLGGNWPFFTPGYRISGNTLQARSFAYFSTPLWTANTFGPDQEAYFTFTNVSTAASAQGLILKSNGASLINVLYNVSSSQVEIWTLDSGQGAVQQSIISGVTLANGDIFGANALADGTVSVYKNGTQIGSTNVTSGASPWPTALAQGGGQIGVQFVGTTNPNSASIDDFGGGNVVAVAGSTYMPNLYEVGPLVANPAYRPPLTFDVPNQAIQNAIDDAEASPGDDLIVVYPGQPDLSNPRANPRGAYYTNLIINSPVKLQGVGPGGFQDTTYVPGSIIDGGAFGGDGLVANNWYTTLSGVSWDGNQEIFDGAGITIFAQDGDFTSDFNASIDGFDVRGGNQQGFPGNINEIGGLPTGLPPNLVTQGGAVFANGYARYLQISNNTIQNNGGAYGTVRIGNPDLPAPDTSNHNENVRIVNNRIILNAGTNLAGGIGLFAGADNYEVANNDLCGNFSAEYGGGLTVYGLSPNGAIHDNRIYFNRSYDEGGGVMIAGELPAVPGTLSPGSGPTDIYNNVIQTNMSNDDGGGLRFLMAGNFPMNVYNNMILNNVSTHEGGGIGINDSPDVRVYNNTIMKNQTTATAVTSNGLPAPAGLSTSQNSAPLQATLPSGSPIFSDPLLFNNIFWDNRAGTLDLGQSMVTGLGAEGDVSPIDNWDLGVADGTGVLAPTNSVIQQLPGAGLRAYTDVSNNHSDPAVITPYDISVLFQGWRTNLNFIGAILVSFDLPPSLLGNFHIPSGSPAVNLGATSTGGVSAPALDIDGDVRPSDGGYEAGADEILGATEPPPPTGVAFPTTGLLDAFDTNGALSASWSGSTAANQFFVGRGTARARGTAGDIWWNPTTFGVNQEAYMTLVTIGTSTPTTERVQGLLLKFNGTDPNNADASGIEVTYSTTAGATVLTKELGGAWISQGIFPITINNGDVFGARAQSDGTVSVYLNSVLVGTVDASAWSMNASGGWIGVTYNYNGGRFDNFSGGTMP